MENVNLVEVENVEVSSNVEVVEVVEKPKMSISDAFAILAKGDTGDKAYIADLKAKIAEEKETRRMSLLREAELEEKLSAVYGDFKEAKRMMTEFLNSQKTTRRPRVARQDASSAPIVTVAPLTAPEAAATVAEAVIEASKGPRKGKGAQRA